jgi:hypothetical protein
MQCKNHELNFKVIYEYAGSKLWEAYDSNNQVILTTKTDQ